MYACKDRRNNKQAKANEEELSPNKTDVLRSDLEFKYSCDHRNPRKYHEYSVRGVLFSSTFSKICALDTQLKSGKRSNLVDIGLLGRFAIMATTGTVEPLKIDDLLNELEDELREENSKDNDDIFMDICLCFKKYSRAADYSKRFGKPRAHVDICYNATDDNERGRKLTEWYIDLCHFAHFGYENEPILKPRRYAAKYTMLIKNLWISSTESRFCDIMKLRLDGLAWDAFVLLALEFPESASLSGAFNFVSRMKSSNWNVDLLRCYIKNPEEFAENNIKQDEELGSQSCGLSQSVSISSSGTTDEESADEKPTLNEIDTLNTEIKNYLIIEQKDAELANQALQGTKMSENPSDGNLTDNEICTEKSTTSDDDKINSASESDSSRTGENFLSVNSDSDRTALSMGLSVIQGSKDPSSNCDIDSEVESTAISTSNKISYSDDAEW